MIYYTTSDSPLGELSLFGDGESLLALYMPQHRHQRMKTVECRRDGNLFSAAVGQLAAYFAGELQDFDLPLAPAGTPFQKRVWHALQQIPYGSTRSYSELAERIGQPQASRAVGTANGRNPISILIPCHRVIGADGSLTGYGGGLQRKQWLLSHEAESD